MPGRLRRTASVEEGARQQSSTRSRCATSSRRCARRSPISRRSIPFSTSRSIFRAGSRRGDQLRRPEGAGRAPHGPRLRASRAAAQGADRLRRRSSDAQGVRELRRATTRRARTDAAFEAFKARLARARNGIVFTAHPTFGLSEALSDRMAEIAVTGDGNGQKIGAAASARRTAHARLRARARAERDPQPARRLLSTCSAISSRPRTSVRRPRLQAEAAARDVRLVGRLRPRRAHGHQVDVLVPHPPQGKAAALARHPRALPGAEGHARRRRRDAAARRAR